MAQQSDDLLIEQSRGGDLAAFKRLVQRYEGKVAGVVRSMLGATPEAEDVGQEVFIRFYESLDKFRGESAVGTYLIRIAINLSLNEIKRRKRRFSFFAGEEEGFNKGETDNRKDMSEMIAYEFDRLDPDFRAVATLRLVEGYSTEETATMLAIPLGTVLSRLARAQKKLRIALEKHLK
ncbi:MAG: sigma-70 family RNA polymerase sigma factor [Bacteroidetes bacterium]|nr:sigma-70 family RNA polymerase sigma factor [Bacteroidota bacterium]